MCSTTWTGTIPGRALVRQRRAGDDADDAGVPEHLAAGQHRDGIQMMLAVAVDATYRVDYQNYKEAAVTYKIK